MSDEQQAPTSANPQTEGAVNEDRYKRPATFGVSPRIPLAGPLPDFDLNNRRNVAGNKRRNASAGYLNIIGSHLGIGGRPATPTSPKAPQKSRGNRFSKILGRSQSQRTEQSQSEEEDPDKGLDPLPDNKNDLEIRLNYHLSELDRLFKCVQTINEIILEHEQKYEDVRKRALLFGIQMNKSVAQLSNIAFNTIKMRKEYEPQVAYHRYEIERVARQMVMVKKMNGEEPRLSDVFRTLRTVEQWVKLFRVGGRLV